MTSPSDTPINLAQLADKITQASGALQREAADAAGSPGDREELALRFCHRLLAIIRAVLDEKQALLPSAGWRVIVVSLIIKTVSSVRAAHALAAAGHGRDVAIVVRSALESLITALFIMNKDGAQRAKRWVQYGVLLRARFLEKYPDLSPKPEHTEARRKILTQAHRVKKNFPDLRFWASGLGRGSVRHLAEDVEMLWYYDFVYWHGSQRTHASAVAVEDYVEMSPQGAVGYRVGLSVKGLRGELAVCCDLLVRALAALDGVCKLHLAALFDELIPEYQVAMGGEPVAEMVAARKQP